MADITLNESGPTPSNFDGTPGQSVSIENAMSTDTNLTADAGAFNPNPPTTGTTITANSTSNFRLGGSDGTYHFNYTVPDPELGSRGGTITISR